MARRVIIKNEGLKTIYLKNSQGKRMLKKADIVEVVDMKQTLEIWPDSTYPKRRMILNNYKRRSHHILHRQQFLNAIYSCLSKEFYK